MFSIRRLVALCQAEVDDINRIFGLIVSTYQEVIRLDIPMDDPLLVHDLDPLYHLDGYVQYCLQIELSAALLELVLQALSEQVHDHDMVHLTIFGLFVADEMQIGHGRRQAR